MPYLSIYFNIASAYICYPAVYMNMSNIYELALRNYSINGLFSYFIVYWLFCNKIKEILLYLVADFNLKVFAEFLYRLKCHQDQAPKSFSIPLIFSLCFMVC